MLTMTELAVYKVLWRVCLLQAEWVFEQQKIESELELAELKPL